MLNGCGRGMRNDHENVCENDDEITKGPTFMCVKKYVFPWFYVQMFVGDFVKGKGLNVILRNIYIKIPPEIWH